jgi:hypothetical protein
MFQKNVSRFDESSHLPHLTPTGLCAEWNVAQLLVFCILSRTDQLSFSLIPRRLCIICRNRLQTPRRFNPNLPCDCGRSAPTHTHTRTHTTHHTRRDHPHPLDPRSMCSFCNALQCARRLQTKKLVLLLRRFAGCKKKKKKKTLTGWSGLGLTSRLCGLKTVPWPRDFGGNIFTNQSTKPTLQPLGLVELDGLSR